MTRPEYTPLPTTSRRSREIIIDKLPPFTRIVVDGLSKAQPYEFTVEVDGAAGNLLDIRISPCRDTGIQVVNLFRPEIVEMKDTSDGVATRIRAIAQHCKQQIPFHAQGQFTRAVAAKFKTGEYKFDTWHTFLPFWFHVDFVENATWRLVLRGKAV